MIEYIKQRISDSPLDSISYADFIEAALYHPEFGYYMKDAIKIGREGDFYTTSNISNLYGRLLAKWYSSLVVKHGLPANVCELGAGTGRFAKSFIEEWQNSSSPPLSYTLVETSPYHRQIQKETLAEFLEFPITQVENMEEIKQFNGLIFSNELFDALPVHVIQKVNGDLFEVMVTSKDDHFIEKLVPLSNKQIVHFMNSHQIRLNESQRLEIPLAMINLISSMAECLERGLVITVDYGYTSDDWQKPSRNNGSLRGFHKHQLIENVLQNPGEIDITSHVHFDVIIREGAKVGLAYINKIRQDQFLLSLGILNELQNNYDTNPFSEISKRNRAIRSLLMPNGLSPFFHVIVQHKGLEDISTGLIKKT